MKYNFSWWVLLSCLVLFAKVAGAVITVSIDRNPVHLNESFQIYFEADSSIDEDPDFSSLQQFFSILNSSHSSNISVINGNYKGISPGRALTTFLMGSKRLFDYVDDNPFIEMRAADFVNDVGIIMQNPRMVAINSAIEIDVTGQVCADSIGMNLYSGVGGQMDFIRGASLSDGGKAIIALPSITNKGVNRIVPFLRPGAGVVTTRAHIHYVVTEYGVANLYGKTIKQRVKALTEIAHPNFREDIARDYFDKKIR